MKTKKEKLNKLIKEEDTPLFTVSTIFPFTLFPDIVEIYPNKLLIKKKLLPFNKNQFPILIEDIKTVTVNAGPLFASLFFEIKGYETNPKPIGYLPKKKAIKARKLIMGLVLSQRKEIRPLTQTDKDELIEKLSKLGE